MYVWKVVKTVTDTLPRYFNHVSILFLFLLDRASLDRTINTDQLDVTCFLFHYLMLNMFRMLIHPSSGACDLFVELFHGLYCSGTVRVGVTLWFGWGDVVSGCRLKH